MAHKFVSFLSCVIVFESRIPRGVVIVRERGDASPRRETQEGKKVERQEEGQGWREEEE